MPALDAKPDPSSDVTELISAFRILSVARSGNGYGPNPLSLVEMEAYIRLMGEPELPREIFVSLIMRMDTRYLKITMEKLKKPGGGKT